MDNIIDYIKFGRSRISEVLDFLSGQLDLMYQCESVDFSTLLEAVDFLDSYSDSFLIPKETTVFEKSCEIIDSENLNQLIDQYQKENIELKGLVKSLRECISCVMNDVIFDREIFEEKLENCIEREREHMDTELNKILPVLKILLTNNQIKELNKSYKLSQDGLSNLNQVA